MTAGGGGATSTVSSTAARAQRVALAAGVRAMVDGAQSLFCDTGGGGGEILEEAGTFFQGRHCFCPTPTLGGGGGGQGGRHPLTALSTVPTHLWYIQLRGGIDISL